MPAKRLVQGNEACAMGALAADCRFFAGYPISPSSEIAEYMARQLPRVGGVFIQMEDEMASMGAVLGAALGGKKAMTATSGPGFSLMQENLGYASLAEIPCVVVDVMRVGPSTGVPTAPAQGDVMQARWGSHGDRAAIALAPASVAEVYELTIASFNLAERLRTPVILLYDEVIGHMREGVVLAEQAAADFWRRPFPDQEPGAGFQPYRPNDEGVAALPDFGVGYRFHVTGLMHDERGYPTTDPVAVNRLLERLDKKVAGVEDWLAPERYRLEDADVVFIAYGITARMARQAVDHLRERGMQAGLFRPRALWPFPAAAVQAATRQARAVVVAEMNLGQWVYAVEHALAGAVPVVRCLKVGGDLITEHELEEQALPLFQGQQGVIVR
ncbi:MAG TPA: 2-oxoacid:acceptor oxidoreductase subunit alpha [Ktedonobacteraceae bacterium]|nr:2-oxoacid:acceptor oxidoreductase subunit alpha [Ktedonobacteraceae bacterium]